jgi:cytochrome c553
VHCHGPGDAPRNPAFPRLDGQDPEYLAAQLRLLRGGLRGGTAYAVLMEAVAAHGLDDARIDHVTSWYAALEP